MSPKGDAMKKSMPAILAAAVVSVVAAPAAFAHDYSSDIRSDVNDIQRDRAHIAADVRHVREERGEVMSARRRQFWAWWHGDYRAAHRAAEHAQEERSDLWAARRKLNRDVADIQRNRADLRKDLAPYNRHWWY
jgi:hypothetical protein